MEKAILNVIGSSSKGNGYIIECSKETLIIELGCKYEEYTMATNLNKVVGCIVSHSHGDHFKFNTFKKFNKVYVDVFSNKDVCECHEDIKLAKIGEITRIGGFSIQPIPVRHSVECYGYLIKHEEFGKLVFITDLSDFNYNIGGVNHWMIESNYDGMKIIDEIIQGTKTRSMFSNHLSIGQAVDIIDRNYCNETQNIVLIHLSDENSDEVGFVKRMKNVAFASNVFVAEKGMNITLSKSEF